MNENSTVTAGVDFASSASKTAACSISWRSNEAEVIELEESCDDNYLLALAKRVSKLGIDVPLGWPSTFVEALRAHQDDGSWPSTYDHQTNLSDYRFRKTDSWLRNDLKLSLPLSVSTDRIAIPAMRAAALVAQIKPRVELDGSGLVVEVYPAAALSRWGFQSRQYKGTKYEAKRRVLIETFLHSCPWLHVNDDVRERCLQNDNAFDAVIAALVSRAALVGLVEPVPMDLRDAAKREGWIAIPHDGTLAQLTTSPS